jgi:hypothetical protein
MHERPGQLDQSFVKVPVRRGPTRQPESFQHFMGFEVKLAVEAVNKREVVGVKVPTSKGGDMRFNLPVFVAHAWKVEVRAPDATRLHGKPGPGGSHAWTEGPQGECHSDTDDTVT